MNLEAARLVPLASSARRGRVARFEGIVVLVDHEVDPVGTAVVLDVCRAASEDGSEVVVERLGGLLARSARPIPPFCVVASAGDGVVVTVHGTVDVRVGDDREPLVRDGHAEAWVTRRVATGSYVSAVLDTGALAPIDDLVDLRRGVVSSSGFVLAAAEAEEAASPPAFAVVPLREPEGDREDRDDIPAPPQEPLPIVGRSIVGNLPPPPPPPAPAPPPPPPPPVAAPIPDAPVAPPAPGMVEGVHCARGHFNDPRANYCGVCGIAMHQISRLLVPDVRPPLGVVVLDDGSSLPLRNDLVVGRDPFEHPRVVRGEADAAVLDGGGGTVSRWHAQIRLDGWDVVLVDEGSTNGTFVWDDVADAWQRLAEGRGMTLEPGTRLAFGRRTGVFESSFNQQRS